VSAESADGGSLSKACRVDRWIFSTDGVGFPIPSDDTTVQVPDSKRWVDSGPVRYPAMFGCGPGIEQNTHKIGECVDLRELQHAIAMLSRFPSLYAASY
jgi:acetylornithine deacetylase/succinyl-diaminopimelate desuccinylase-like protein